MLLSSTCVSGLSLSKSAKRRRAAASSNSEAGGLGSGEKIIVGAAGGVVTVWERGEWGDHAGRVKVAGDSSVEPAIPSGTRGFGAEAHDDDCTVDVLQVVPEWVGGLEGRARGGRLAVAGLGHGGMRVMRLRGGGGEVVGGMRHDEGGVEGVITLGFEREGRLISGGGQVVKVWEVGRGDEGDYHEEIEIGGDGSDEEEEEEGEEDDEPIVVMGSPDNSDDNSDDSDDSDNDRQKRKKRKKGGKKGNKGGNHGISGVFRGMD